ncbi:MAG: PKD domain-containing protein [Ferruginibacter sp.]
MPKLTCLIITILFSLHSHAQNELSNWYFGYGTDGIRFVNGVPQKLSDKVSQVGFEGMIVVNDPLTGNLFFYSDGDRVIDKNHNVMTNGSGMTGHYSGAQCVQSCPVPGTCYKKFYLFTNSAWDNTAGKISYSIVDFSSNPLGEVTNKNTLFWNGPSDQAMCLINKPGTEDYWLINNAFGTAQYYVWPVTAAAGIGTPLTYTFSNTGDSYQMNFDNNVKKLCITGGGSKLVTLMDFDPANGVLSNEIQLAPSNQYGASGATRFSPDGSKLYAGLSKVGNVAPTLYQYDFNTSTWNDMNTCCYAHDLKIGPDGKMYHIHTYNNSQPIAVIDFPNRTAVGNACNYHTLTFTPAFNGEVRRFPETLVLPVPPSANTDSMTVSNAAIDIPVITNDFDPKGDQVSLDAVLTTAAYGTAVKSGNNIRYTPNQNICGRTDTLIYRITDNNCGTDTAKVFVKFPVCTGSSQFCTGSLGSPVVNITFGSGPNYGSPLSVAVPGATTTYAYVTSGFSDGSYSLTNTVPNNSAWFGGEHDHTGDPNGYMAFFNSDPTPGGEFYRQTVNSLCPGTTYEFAVWIANVVNSNILPGGIPPNVTFKILNRSDNSVIASYNTGDIANGNSMNWKQYSMLFTLPAGINDIILILTNNNVGGNAQPGNDLGIDDITFRPCGPSTSASFLPGAQSDSISIDACTAASAFGKITGNFNNPSYQWQLSKDGGITFNNIQGATSLNANVSGLTNGLYQLQLLSAESGNISSPSCRFISNRLKLLVTGCPTAQSVKKIINDYTPVTTINFCDNRITTKDGSAFKTGDTVVVMQMKGAIIDESNSSSFGDILNYRNAGNYEFNYIKSKAGNIIELQNVLTKKYDFADGRVQLIRVPYFQSITISDTLSCLPWDGEKGGVLVLNVRNNITLNAPIDVTAMGFRGGGPGTGFNCGSADWASTTSIAGMKGEGITEYVLGKEAGGAKQANGGGGGMGGNTGAGGGGNFGPGGTGGKEYNLYCPGIIRSISGVALNFTDINKIYLGGGGGGGQQDNGQLVLPGGRGGGIIIVKAASLNSNNQKINARGEEFPIIIQDEGGNGGGAGGSILLNINNYTGNLLLDANGGTGSSNYNVIFPADCHGPGGGGGGGYIAFSNASLPAGITTTYEGGLPGKVLNPLSVCFNTTYGAEKGGDGGRKFSINLPADGPAFEPNIDSIRIKDSATTCATFDLTGRSFVKRDSILSWQWEFGDNATGINKNISHTYPGAGTYKVKLTATDTRGCIDSSTKNLVVILPLVTAGADKSVCHGEQVQLSASGAISYKWQPAASLNNPDIFNPIASPSANTQYIVTGTLESCTVNDTVNVTVIPSPTVSKTSDTLICEGFSLRLRVSGADSYVWSPAATLDNPASATPVAKPVTNTTYYVRSTSAAFNCSATDSVKVTLKKPGLYTVAPGKSVCAKSTVQLFADGGDEYLWSPANLINNPAVNNPSASLPATTTFTVKIKDRVCEDSTFLNTTFTAIPLPEITVTKSNDIDCFTDTVQLNATGADTYLWTSNQAPLYLNDATIANPIAYLRNAKTYFVTGTSNNTGCKNTATINILAMENSQPPFYMPNAFSPNGDGHNDCYRIHANGTLKGFEMSIYNRWGERVFHTRDINECWDGRFMGKAQSAGNFIVYVWANNKCIRNVAKNNLLLIR